MSTEFAALPAAPESLAFRGPHHSLSISVRVLCPATDMPFIYKWMSCQVAGPLVTRNIPPMGLEESYSSMIESDFAQPFMCLVNNVPVCQVDIYKTLQDTLSLYYDARPGDYGLNLLIAPLEIQHNITILIKACLEYLFAFPEVGRIVVDIEEKNEWTNTLIKMAGFHHMQKISIPYKMANLYVCTRDNLRHHR